MINKIKHFVTMRFGIFFAENMQDAYNTGLEHGVEAACAYADEAYQQTRVGFTASL